ncbi:hypothetical protein F0U60_43980 [Archangium minus]|uniref:Uncharacterized protein n=1 Tax=Archangium minus TaxID=83450 RepID=A0ABY9X4J1_9BACT|nr:hypothetical protein F0U60_43980 [Archangium minus]
MKTTRLSLLLAGLASMAAGCQPETETLPTQESGSTLKAHEAKLDTPVGTWTSNASSLSEFSGHTVTLMRGTGNVLVTASGKAEVYNPYTDTWRRTASPLTLHTFHAATELPSGKVLVTGGRDGSNLWTTSSELYDPDTETWSPTSPMLTPRSSHAATRLDSGKVLVVGGVVPQPWNGPLAEVYDPQTDTWSGVSGSFTPRSRIAQTELYSGKVLVTGGYTWWTSPAGDASSEVNIYDPATNSISPAGNLARARHGHFAIRLYSGNVLIVGGIDGGSTVEIYDPYSGQWSLGPPFPFNTGILFSATMLYSGEVLVTTIDFKAALYDPSTNTWIPTTPMKEVRSFTQTALLHTGEVLMVGGGPPRSVERFTR